METTSQQIVGQFSVKTLIYKQHIAAVKFDPEGRMFVGHVVDVPDIVGIRGRTMDECAAVFHEAVDDYLRVLSLRAEAGFELRARRGQGRVSVGLSLLRKAAGRSSKA